MSALFQKFAGQDGYISRFRNIRNLFLAQVEGMFLVLNLSMGLLSWIMLGTGISFLASDSLSKQQFGFHRLKGALIMALIFYIAFLNIMAVLGVVISYTRSCTPPCICLWGIAIFFGGALPLFVEGDLILYISNMDDDDFYSPMCLLNKNELESEQKWVKHLAQSVRRFDLMSEVLLNEYMCTETCPCLKYNDQTKDRNPWLEYSMILEEKLNRYRRTNMDMEFAKPKGLIPIKWTSDKNFGFKSFLDCYEYYEDKAEEDENFDLAEKFKFNQTLYGELGSAFMGPQGPWRGSEDVQYRDNDRMGEDPSLWYLLSHMKEIDLYQIMEDDFDCSGMCKPALFYFSLNTENGPPTETCLMHFKHALQKAAKPFAVMEIIVATFCLLLAMTHWCLQLRPESMLTADMDPDSVDIDQGGQQQERQVDNGRGGQGHPTHQQLPVGSFQSDFGAEKISVEQSIEFSDIRPENAQQSKVEQI